MQGDHPPETGPDRDDSFVYDQDVEILAQETVYQGFFRMDRYQLRHRKHDGGWTGTMVREVFERGHAVAVVLYDPLRDSVVLLEQFRIPAMAAGKAPWQIEVVAGIFEAGESPEDVARRETREESGLTLRELIPLYHYLVSPGGTSETVHLYCGIVDSREAGGLHGVDAEGEDIKVTVHSFAEAWGLVESGRIDNAPALLGLQWLALNRERLRQEYSVD